MDKPRKELIQSSAGQPDASVDQIGNTEHQEPQASVGERVYERSSSEGPLRQGEILSGMIQLKVNLQSLEPENEPTLDPVSHPYAVIVTQDCELVQDFKVRKQEQIDSDKLIPSILFCEAIAAEDLHGRADIKSDIWKRIRQNKDERYQFLEKVPPEDDLLELGIPELGIDFKRYFSIPTGEAYFWIKSEANRRCKLVGPYLQHFSTRFYNFQARVALPAEHHSE